MSEVQDFYLRQVALSAKAADETDLANQRDKYLRSQAAWQVLADRAGKTAAAKASVSIVEVFIFTAPSLSVVIALAPCRRQLNRPGFFTEIEPPAGR